MHKTHSNNVVTRLENCVKPYRTQEKKLEHPHIPNLTLNPNLALQKALQDLQLATHATRNAPNPGSRLYLLDLGTE